MLKKKLMVGGEINADRRIVFKTLYFLSLPGGV